MNEMGRKKESTPGENLAKQIIEQYNPKSVADMQNALKDIFGPMFEAMLQGEMNSHLGYESNDHGAKFTDNRRNGYTSKKIKTSSGEVDIKVPRDKDSFSESRVSGEKIKTGESNDFQKEKVNQSHPRKDALKREEKNSEVKPEEPGLDTQRQQEVTDAGNEVISEVAQALDISEEEVLDAMEELGLSISAILDPDQLTKLVVSLSA